MTSPTPAPVLVELRGQGPRKLAVVTLNSEATLNSLTIDMIEVLIPHLEKWSRDDSIAAVWLQGAGEKAFCAGGDIRRLHGAITSKQYAGAEEFFEKEYSLDHAIHVFPKPFLVWGHGIVMGGGLGLMAGASHRIVTETTKVAMPEISIGLSPDIGSSYFLNAMPPGVGLFLGLTGQRLNAADCLLTKIGNVFVTRARKEPLLRAIEASPWTDDKIENMALVNQSLQKFEAESTASLPAGEIQAHLPLLQTASHAETVEDFAEWLKSHAADDAWLGTAAKTFFKGSPTSAKVIFEQLKRARGLSLEQCFALEMTLSTQYAQHHDLAEGIRALIIEKDNSPRWSPATLAQVSDHLVREHFAWPYRDRPNPLEKKWEI